MSEKMLAQTLQALEADGFVLRKAYPVIPPRVDTVSPSWAAKLQNRLRGWPVGSKKTFRGLRTLARTTERQRDPLASSVCSSGAVVSSPVEPNLLLPSQLEQNCNALSEHRGREISGLRSSGRLAGKQEVGRIPIRRGPNVRVADRSETTLKQCQPAPQFPMSFYSTER
jgi:HxlR-like helix-turn-helix